MKDLLGDVGIIRRDLPPPRAAVFGGYTHKANKGIGEGFKLGDFPARVLPWASMRSAARCASIIVGALVLPEVILGKLDASMTRRPVVPNTRHSESSTAVSAEAPIRHVETG